MHPALRTSTSSVILLAILAIPSLAQTLRKQIAQHGPLHAPAKDRTNTEYHDSNADRPVVSGQITVAQPRGGGAPARQFRSITIRYEVHNKSEYHWDYWVLTHEFAEHPAQNAQRHWTAEGYGTDPPLGPQPVFDGATLFTLFNVPGGAAHPGGIDADVPAKRFGKLRKGTKKQDQDAFSFAGGDASQGGAMSNYIVAARVPDANGVLPDIFWARETSKGVSDYPQPLATKGSVGPPPIAPTATRLDVPNVAAGNVPGNGSNVSVFPSICAKAYRKLVARADVTIDPSAATVTVVMHPGAIPGVVGIPSSFLYAQDPLHQATFQITAPFQYQETLDATHFFDGGVFEVILGGSTVFRSELSTIVAAPIVDEGNVHHTYAHLLNPTFPLGTAVTPWLRDFANDLANGSSSGTLIFDAANVPFATYVDQAFQSGNPVQMGLDLVLAVNAPDLESELLGPTVIDANPTQQSTPGLSPAVLGVSSVMQINFVRDPTLPPGRSLCTMTVTGLPGGSGGQDLLSGVYDSFFDVFLADGHALPLNTPGDEFGLMCNPSLARSSVIHPAGTVAVWDTGSSSYSECAVRPTTSSSWNRTGSIQGIPLGYADVTLATVRGELWLLWVDYSSPQSIQGAPFDPSVPGITASPTTFVEESSMPDGMQPHSPTPMTGGDGDTEALFFDATVPGTNDSDPFYLSHLSAHAPIFALPSTSGWSNNGGLIGGTLFQAYWDGTNYGTYAMQLGLLTGDDETHTFGSANRMCDLTLHTPIFTPGSQPFWGLMLLDAAQNPPLQLPPLDGALVLFGPNSLTLPLPPIPTATGELTIAIPVPANLGGYTLYAQGLLVRPTPLAYYGAFTNDCMVRL